LSCDKDAGRLRDPGFYVPILELFCNEKIKNGALPETKCTEVHLSALFDVKDDGAVGKNTREYGGANMGNLHERCTTCQVDVEQKDIRAPCKHARGCMKCECTPLKGDKKRWTYIPLREYPLSFAQLWSIPITRADLSRLRKKIFNLV